jgi:uncharacterized RDD family membrane protein YckC
MLVALAGLPPPTFGLGGLENLTHSAVTGVLWTTYYVGCEAAFGATLGKRILDVAVRRPERPRPGLAGAMIRNLWLLFGLLPWIGGILQVAAAVTIAFTIARDEHHRGVHDRLAGTIATIRPDGAAQHGMDRR